MQFKNKYLNVTITQRNAPANVWFWRFYVTALAADYSPPKALTQLSLPKNSFYPGDEISMTFDEPIDCAVLVASLLVSDGSVMGQSNFVLVCSENSVLLDFSSSMSVAVCHVCCVDSIILALVNYLNLTCSLTV